ncbi:MAG: type II secretion system GspH family protein [Verrucomicrobiae bacterium]|nr:type II secretion system GspH family protein [Verrucomicrobiae bacterium]
MRSSRDANAGPFHLSRFTFHVRGFTLIELLAVVGIIAILAGIVLAAAGWAQRKVAADRTRATINLVACGVDMNKADVDWYPPDARKNDAPAEYINPAMALWYYLQYRQEEGIGQAGSTPHKPYVKFSKNQLIVSDKTVAGRPDNYMMVADAWGRPLNYKSNDGNSYPFGMTAPGDSAGSKQPRHNRNSFDLCSYGPNGTTWKDKDEPFSLEDLSMSGGSGNVPPNYFYRPFNTLSEGHCYGGEEGDDINNWQKR